MFYFHKVAYVQYLGEVDIFFTHEWKFLSLYNSAKIVKTDQDFPKLWSQMYWHLFMVHSVYRTDWRLSAMGRVSYLSRVHGQPAKKRQERKVDKNKIESFSVENYEAIVTILWRF